MQKKTDASRYLASVRRKPARSESELQQAVVRACRGVYAGIVQERFFAVPGGWFEGSGTALSRAIQGKKLKDEGARPGIVDLIFYAPVARTLWLELKNGSSGSVSPVQREVHESLRDCGHTVIVVRDFTAAVKEIIHFFRPDR